MAGGTYDWWAAEGRPERLRPLQDELDRLMEDETLRAEDVTILAGHVDMDRERLEVEIATADARRAKRLLRDVSHWPIEAVVVARAAFVEDEVPWTLWEPGTRDRELFVWAENLESSDPQIVVVEDEPSVTITLRESRWQGARTTDYSLARIPVTLGRPLAGRRVIDGATGLPRPHGSPF